MPGQALHGIMTKDVLSEEDLGKVRDLADTCNAHEGLDLKLNWELMRARSGGRSSDFLYYDHGVLVGYLALDGFGEKLELTGMVHPGFRRRGVFSTLLDVAVRECEARRPARLLLVCERKSASGQAFVASTIARYDFSEYHLELDAQSGPRPDADGLPFRLADLRDIGALVRLDVVCFGGGEDAVRERVTRDLENPASRYYVVEREGEAIGKIGVALEDGGAYVRGVGVLPEYRGRGYGRRMLEATIDAMVAENRTSLALDVVCENSGALSLYLACGFQVTNCYDYYEYDLSSPRRLH